MAETHSRYTFDDVTRITMRATCFDDGGFVKLTLRGRDGEEVVIEIHTAHDFVAPAPIDLSAAQVSEMEPAQ